jgi:hypothetical protein
MPLHAMIQNQPDEVVIIGVPLNRRRLKPIGRERVRNLRKHLVEALRAVRTMKGPASPLRPEPEGFVGQVVRAACTLCKGWCCKAGGEHAYLDERTLARVREARPELDARAVLRLYVERVPEKAYDRSCIFHGERGCTLDRALRSDICNVYLCGELGDFVLGNVPAKRVDLFAEHEGERRRSRVTRRNP